VCSPPLPCQVGLGQHRTDQGQNLGFDPPNVHLVPPLPISSFACRARVMNPWTVVCAPGSDDAYGRRIFQIAGLGDPLCTVDRVRKEEADRTSRYEKRELPSPQSVGQEEARGLDELGARTRASVHPANMHGSPVSTLSTSVLMILTREPHRVSHFSMAFSCRMWARGSHTSPHAAAGT
jgi:hypothetical protein